MSNYGNDAFDEYNAQCPECKNSFSKWGSFHSNCKSSWVEDSTVTERRLQKAVEDVLLHVEDGARFCFRCKIVADMLKEALPKK